MGKIVSQLLADALSRHKNSRDRYELSWISRPMQALVDLDDKDALYTALEKDAK